MKAVISVNNKIFCEPYLGGKGLKSEVKSGFATVQQKNNLVPLKVVANAQVRHGDQILSIPKGSVLYFSEEMLYLHQQYHNPVKSSALGIDFVIANFEHVLGVELG